MTNGEKREQKAMLLLEYQEAEEELAYLEEKALRLSELLRVVSDDLAASKTNDYPSAIKADPQLKSAMDLDAVITLMAEINKEKHKVRKLQERKTALGLK